MMSGLNGLTGQIVLWNVVEDSSIEHGCVRGEQMSVMAHHACLVIATPTNVKVCTNICIDHCYCMIFCHEYGVYVWSGLEPKSAKINDEAANRALSFNWTFMETGAGRQCWMQ